MSKRKLRSALKRKLDILLNIDVQEKKVDIAISSDIKLFRMFQGKRVRKRVHYPSQWSYHNGKDNKKQNAFSDIEKQNKKLERENLKRFAEMANKRKGNNRG